MDKIELLKAKIGISKTDLEELKGAVEKRDGVYTKEETEKRKVLIDSLTSLLDELGMAEKEASIDAIFTPKATRGIEVSDELDADIAKGKYKLGNYLRNIAISSRSGAWTPDVIKYNNKIKAEQRAILGGSESVPSDGGFLVGEDFLGGVIKNMWDNSQLLSRCTRRTLSTGSNTLKVNGIDESSRADGSRNNGTVAYWLAEGGDKTPSKPKFKQLTLELQKLAALYYATDELLEDATALTQEVTEAFMDEMNFKIQDAIFRGDGAGKPQGILSSPSLVTVAKETGQLASTILYQNIVKMYSRFMGNNGIWIANRDIFPQLSQMSLAVGTGGAPAYMPANGLAGVPYNTLVGLPIIFIEQASTVGTEGDIVLADMGQYLVAEKGGIVGASSIHVEFTTGQTVFRWLYRIDGQTKTSSPITPANGTATVSPFISLATRA